MVPGDDSRLRLHARLGLARKRAVALWTSSWGIPILGWLSDPHYRHRISASNSQCLRVERLALLMLVGVFLYLVKIIRDPFVFDFADEFNQAYNTTEVLTTRALFGSNPLLPATPDYPGLASLTAALASLTHLSVFSAGLIVIAAARTIMILAVYLLLERATDSPQVAGLGALAYTAAPNFLLFTAEVLTNLLLYPSRRQQSTASCRGPMTVRVTEQAGLWQVSSWSQQ